MAPKDVFFSVGSIILDDIVLPDGETRLAILGGGATHAAMGMRTWTDRVGIVATIGDNFQSDQLDVLGAYFDLHGLQRRSIPTLRAWQVYEADGQRTEVFRTSLEEFLASAPQPQEMPLEYSTAPGVHLQCTISVNQIDAERDSSNVTALSHIQYPLQSWITHLRSVGYPSILWEPWDIFCIPENRAIFRSLLPQVDIFSPNLREAQRITGQVEPKTVAQALLDDGARCVAMRMGEQGSLVVEKNSVIHLIPALPVQCLVDVTGAGNAYCGGFMVGLARTGDPYQAGMYGAVSASLALEQFGALFPLQGLRQKAEGRLAVLQSQLHRPIFPANPRRQVFDRMATGWDQRPVAPDAPGKLKRVTAAGAIPRNGQILDLGAGTGILTSALLTYQPSQLVTVDLSPAMIRVLKKDRFPSDHAVQAVVGDGSWLPFPSAAFNTIFCHAVFPHFPNQRLALSELNRVLKPGGRLVISHTIGRQQVNAIHQNGPDQVLHHDLLPATNELARLLSMTNWQMLESVDEPDFYLVVATPF